MAIHIHPVIQPPEKAQVFHGVTPVATPAKTTSKAAADFAALFTASARQPAGITVSAPATTSTPSTSTGAAATAAAASGANASTASTSNATPVSPVSTSAGDGPAGPLFGPSPWLTDPTGSGLGSTTHYSPYYFATPQTAQTVASMLGGTVVAANEIITASGSPFTQDQPNLMVQLPNGGLVNPGLIATLFTHNWPTSFVNQQIANEVAGAVPANSTT